MVVLKYLVYILQKRNAAVFHNVCPQLLFVLGTVEHNDEDLGPITLELWPEVHLVHKKSNSFLKSNVYNYGITLPIGDFEKSKSV